MSLRRAIAVSRSSHSTVNGSLCSSTAHASSPLASGGGSRSPHRRASTVGDAGSATRPTVRVFVVIVGTCPPDPGVSLGSSADTGTADALAPMEVAARVGHPDQQEVDMKAVVYEGPRQVAVKDVPDARIERPTDVLVRITSANICGSDLHMYEGRTVPKESPLGWWGLRSSGGAA